MRPAPFLGTTTEETSDWQKRINHGPREHAREIVRRPSRRTGARTTLPRLSAGRLQVHDVAPLLTFPNSGTSYTRAWRSRRLADALHALGAWGWREHGAA